MSWRLVCAAHEVGEGLSVEESQDNYGLGDQELKGRLSNLSSVCDPCLSVEDLS